MEDKEIQVKIPKIKKEENKKDNDNIFNDIQINNKNNDDDLFITQQTKITPKVVVEPKIINVKQELSKKNNDIKINKTIETNKKEKKYKSCIPKEYHDIPLSIDKFYFLKKLYNDLFKKFTKAKK